MHKDWCGKPCEDCGKPCWVDESIPCSPSCEMLSEDGFPIDIEACFSCGCDAYESMKAYLHDIII